MNSRSLPLALALYAVLTLALILVVPFKAAPDEGAHADYVAFVATHRALPVFQGQPPPAYGYEFHQPPLFYLVAAPLWSLGASVQVALVRLLSLLCGLLTIGVVWKTARLVFGEESHAPTLCAFACALSPLHQSIGASINNDALAGLWAACLFALVARAWLGEPSRRIVLLTGAVAGLGALTKLTALPLGVWALVCLGVSLRQHGQRVVPALAPAVIVALTLAAPMLVRNQTLYGDPFAYALFSRAATLGTPGLAWAQNVLGLSAFDYARNMASQLIATAWGFGGGPNTWATWSGFLSPDGPRLPNASWIAPWLLVVLGPSLGVWLSYRAARDAERDENASSRPLAWCFAVGTLLIVAAWVAFAYEHRSAGQARYLHAALLPLVFLVACGLARSRAGLVVAALLGLTMLGMTLANIFVWKTLV